jgi:hypothetical protein
MHQGEPHSIQGHGRGLRQTPAELRAIVVAIDGDKPSAVVLKFVQQGGRHPVTGMEHHIGALDGGPHLGGKHPGPVGNVGIGDEQEA